MRGIKPKNYWTKERCIEAARNCQDRTDFTENEPQAYNAARNNKWIDEVWAEAGLRSRMDMSWLRPGTRKEIWTKADYFYDIWMENGKCGAWKMKTLTGVNIGKLIKKFSEGWVPANDKDWKLWAKQNS